MDGQAWTEEGKYSCPEALCRSHDLVEGKASAEYIRRKILNEVIRSIKWACYESRNFAVLADRIERGRDMVLQYGDSEDIAVFEEISHDLLEAQRYEKIHGPWSLLNWDHECSVWVEKVLASEGRPTMRQQLESWRAARS